MSAGHEEPEFNSCCKRQHPAISLQTLAYSDLCSTQECYSTMAEAGCAILLMSCVQQVIASSLEVCSCHSSSWTQTCHLQIPGIRHAPHATFAVSCTTSHAVCSFDVDKPVLLLNENETGKIENDKPVLLLNENKNRNDKPVLLLNENKNKMTSQCCCLMKIEIKSQASVAA